MFHSQVLYLTMLARLTKALWNEFVYGSHLLSMAASCILVFSFQMLQIETHWLSLVIPYAIMQIIYKFNYIIETDDYETNPERADHIKKKRRSFILQIILFSVVLIAVLVHIHIIQLYIYCVIYVLGGIWYPKQFTKNIVAFKNIYVTLFWGILGFIPIILLQQSIHVTSFWLVSFIFFRVLVNAIYADFKDVKTDKEQGYKTLPAYVGINQAMLILQFINLLSFGVLVVGIIKNYFPVQSWALLIFMPYNIYYIQTANKESAKKIRLLSYVLVDGEYILWPIVMMLATIVVGYLA